MVMGASNSNAEPILGGPSPAPRRRARILGANTPCPIRHLSTAPSLLYVRLSDTPLSSLSLYSANTSVFCYNPENYEGPLIKLQFLKWQKGGNWGLLTLFLTAWSRHVPWAGDHALEVPIRGRRKGPHWGAPCWRQADPLCSKEQDLRPRSASFLIATHFQVLFSRFLGTDGNSGEVWAWSRASVGWQVHLRRYRSLVDGPLGWSMAPKKIILMDAWVSSMWSMRRMEYDAALKRKDFCTCYYVDRPRGCGAQWQDPDIEGQILCDSVYVGSLEGSHP